MRQSMSYIWNCLRNVDHRQHTIELHLHPRYVFIVWVSGTSIYSRRGSYKSHQSGLVAHATVPIRDQTPKFPSSCVKQIEILLIVVRMMVTVFGRPSHLQWKF
jgi:hypothetical protein